MLKGIADRGLYKLSLDKPDASIRTKKFPVFNKPTSMLSLFVTKPESFSQEVQQNCRSQAL